MSADHYGAVRICSLIIPFIYTHRCEFSMEGGELFDRIKKRKANPYTEQDAADFIRMMVQAVAHLHAMDMVRLLNTRFY